MLRLFWKCVRLPGNRVQCWRSTSSRSWSYQVLFIFAGSSTLTYGFFCDLFWLFTLYMEHFPTTKSMASFLILNVYCALALDSVSCIRSLINLSEILPYGLSVGNSGRRLPKHRISDYLQGKNNGVLVLCYLKSVIYLLEEGRQAWNMWHCNSE